MLRRVVSSVILSSAAILMAGNAFAADCVLAVSRTACPGQEKESFSKCDGKASCEETVPAASAAQCTLKAKSACSNKRLDITKYKKITAKYDGTALDGGKDFCIGHPDFPYASKAECK
ncbi:MAG: hypothetical protein ACR2I0_12200 [Rhodoferax sp.]